jgi:hypothetical protein
LNLTYPQREQFDQPGIPVPLLDRDADWKDFCVRLSDDTANHLVPLWLSNVRANAPLIKRKGAAYDRYRGQGQDKVAVIIGAAPALESNWKPLVGLQSDKRYILIACSTALKFLLNKGIKPRFVIMVDGAPNCARYIDVGDKAKDINLIATCIVHPKSLKAWKGNVRFVRVGIGDQYEREYIKLTGIRDMFPGGGTQYNAAVLFAYMTLQSRILMFVGNALSYDEKYYADRNDDKDNAFQKFAWVDIHGDVAYTNHNLIQSKLWLENQLSMWKGVFINATEAGILGVSKRHGQLPYILQLKLSNAISYCNRAQDKFKEVINHG